MTPAYELLDEVGRGGAGVVFKARRRDGLLVAVKVLTAARAHDRDALVRFDRERRLLASFGQTDGFVPFLDAGVGPRGPFLVMPFLGGGTLRARLREGPLTIDEAVEVVAALAAALGTAHERGIVHRDLKPENVLFTDDGVPLVADLGLAKHFVREGLAGAFSVSVSGDGQLRGTLGYAAPEQLKDAKSAGPPADVFSLGAILYECLTGRAAFVGATELECVARTRAGKLVAVRRLRPEVPPWLAAVVERALAVDPARRFADGAALALALRTGEGGGASRRLAVVAGVAAAASVAISAVMMGRRGGAAVVEVAPRGGPATVQGASSLDAAAVASAVAAGHVERARRALAAGDLVGAVAACDAALAAHEPLPATWLTRARARRRAAQAALARQDLDRALTLDPSLVDAWVDRGALRHEQGDLTGARDDLDRAVELAPGDARARGHRALVLLDLGRLEDAFQEASRASQADVRQPIARVARAAVWLRTRRHVAGIAEADAALTYDPRCALALVMRADGRQQERDAVRELLDLDRAVEFDPGLPLAWAARALARARGDDLEGALADLERAAALAPDHEGYRKAREELRALATARRAADGR